MKKDVGLVLEMPKDEAKILRKTYSRAKVILEYGSGGSTILAAKKSGKLVFSVESDRNWAMQLQRRIDRSQSASPAIVYHVDIGPTGDWGRPIDSSCWRNFHHYPTAIWSEPFFRQPDVVLIDGRFRPACFVTTCLRIEKPITLLFDDYIDRPQYHIVEQLVRPVRIIGRMAEFRLMPQSWPSWTQDLLLELCTQASFSRRTATKYNS